GDTVSSDVDTQTMPLTGTYTLLIEGRFNDTNPGSYTVNVKTVADSTTPLALNVTTSGTIAGSGEQDTYTFTLAAAKTLYLDNLTNDTNLRWTLIGPGGTVVSQRGLYQADSVDANDPALRLPAGSYTLVIDEPGDLVGPY